MPLKFNTLLRAILAGGGGTPQPLRFASPYNRLQTQAPVSASTTYLNCRGRIPFYIGSGDMSQLVFAFSSYTVNSGTINALGNAYTIVSMALEKDGGSYAPVTFSGGRSQVVADGSVEVLSDAILPSAFSLSAFTKGDKYWMRIEYSVASTGLKFMQNFLTYGQMPGANAVGLTLTSGAVVAPVDASGTMTYTSGYSNFGNFYTPLVLGKFVSGDPKTIIGVGDSIIQGTGDTASNGQVGGFSQALTDADRLSNPIAGATFGYSGSVAGLWSGANSAFLRNYLKYAKYAVEEFQTNKFASTNTNLATAKSEVQTLWGYFAAAGITTVLRTKLHPRTTDATNTTLLPSCFPAGGDARLFNDWLDTPSLGVAQGVALTILPINSTRLSTNQTLDNFMFWNVAGSTTDGTHPSPAGHVLEAADFRTAFAALP